MDFNMLSEDVSSSSESEQAYTPPPQSPKPPIFKEVDRSDTAEDGYEIQAEDMTDTEEGGVPLTAPPNLRAYQLEMLSQCLHQNAIVAVSLLYSISIPVY